MSKSQTEHEDTLADKTMQMPTDLGSNAVAEISGVLRHLLADVFALYLKIKNFHWHMSGPHFRDYHLLLDEQSEQIFSMTDDIAEREENRWKLFCSIGDIRDISVSSTTTKRPFANEMLSELSEDNQKLTRFLRSTTKYVTLTRTSRRRV